MIDSRQVFLSGSADKMTAVIFAFIGSAAVCAAESAGSALLSNKRLISCVPCFGFDYPIQFD
ncbi:MAG: hypothetical protein Q7T38_12955 [Gallionella sp.]|nr:hypothetical protein [Gallionella sp.]